MLGIRYSLPLVGLLFAVMGASLLRNRGKVDQEVASWVPATGVVVGHESGSMSSDGGVTLQYPVVRFLDAQGREQHGRALTTASWQRHPEGSSVGLRYDPRDPRRVMVDGAPSNSTVNTLVGAIFTLVGVLVLGIGAVYLIRS